jgi:hypothetical protein
MGRRDRLATQLDEIRALAADPAGDAALGVLRGALAERSSHAVAAAARHIGRHEIAALGGAMADAYARIAPLQAKQDPGCAAKLALIEALSALDHPDPDPFVHGMRHVQLEPSFGPPVDTAVSLRGASLMALVGLSHPDAPVWIGEMLADPEPRCRSAAARCAAAWRDPVLGQALLRLRVLAGEEEPEVLADCFEALVSLDGTDAVEWVCGKLQGDDVVSESAALALGAGRIEAALPRLVGFWSAARTADTRRVALVAIGLLRTDAALAHLLEVVETGSGEDAAHALEAASVFRHDPAAAERIAAAERASAR